jgi:hypothetical protein
MLIQQASGHRLANGAYLGFADLEKPKYARQLILGMHPAG